MQIVKENSNLLKRLEIAGINLEPAFDKETYNYNIEILSSMGNVDLSISAYDSSSTVTVTGNDNIPTGTSKIQITVSNPNLAEDKVYTINVASKTEISEEYSATGNYQVFTAGFNGTYKMELWGAKGESGNAKSGYGAYTAGEIKLSKGEKLYVYVGKSGANGGYNGGGATRNSERGGGASDIRLEPRSLE